MTTIEAPKTTPKEPVRVGQVWADNDWRSQGREVTVLEIDGKYAICSVAGVLKPPKRTRIRLDRFRPNSTGYRLLRQAAERSRETA